MRPDQNQISMDDMSTGEVAHGFRLAAVAVVSAIVTATLVIGVGQVWLSRHTSPPAFTDQPVALIRTAG